jgi:hypothetical protein
MRQKAVRPASPDLKTGSDLKRRQRVASRFPSALAVRCPDGIPFSKIPRNGGGGIFAKA